MKIPETSSELESLLDNRSYSGDHFVFPPRFRSDLTSLFEFSVKQYLSEDGFRLKRRIELSSGAFPSTLPEKLSVVVSLQPTTSLSLVALEINSPTFASCIPSTYSEALYRITIENRSFVLFQAPSEGDFQPFKFRSKHKAYRSNVDNLLLSSGVQVDWKTKTCVPLWNSTGRLEQINPYFKEKEVVGQEDSNNSVSSLRYSISVLPDFLFPKDWNKTDEDDADIAVSAEAAYEAISDNEILTPDNVESPNNDAILNTKEVSEYPTDIISNDSSIIPGKALSEMVERFHKPKESRVDKMLIKLDAYLVSNFFNEARQCQDSLLWYRCAPNQHEWSRCTIDAARKISDKHARKFFNQNFVRDSVSELSEMNKEA